MKLRAPELRIPEKLRVPEARIPLKLRDEEQRPSVKLRAPEVRFPMKLRASEARSPLKLSVLEERPPRKDEIMEIDAIALNDKCLDIGIGGPRAFFWLSGLLLRRVRMRPRHEAQAGQICLGGLHPFAGFVAPFILGFIAVPGARLLKLGLLAQHVFGPGVPRLLAPPPQRDALVLVHA